MTIIEDITYDLDDIINQIQDSFGFVYTSTNGHEGYIILSTNIKLVLDFNENTRKLDRATLVFPDSSIDYIKNESKSDIYLSCIESSAQIVDLIKRMLGEDKDDKDS